jgi:hypothetical protein
MMRNIRLLAGTALLLVAASCTVVPRSAPPPPAPPPAKVAVPAPVPPPLLAPQAVGAWDDQPVIEGGWTRDAARRSARFVDDRGVERASLACSEPGRAMRLTMPGETGGEVQLLTTAGANSLALSDGVAALSVTDIALDRIAFSRGRFALRGSMLVVLPVQSEIGRVIEDCRG